MTRSKIACERGSLNLGKTYQGKSGKRGREARLWHGGHTPGKTGRCETQDTRRVAPNWGEEYTGIRKGFTGPKTVSSAEGKTIQSRMGKTVVMNGKKNSWGEGHKGVE